MKTIELLLTQNIPNLGIIGDVVKVRPGYGRNYLMPRGLAAIPTPGAVEALAEQRAEATAQMEKFIQDQQKLVDKITDYELTIERTANEQGVLFAAVSAQEIAEALRQEGFVVKNRFIRLGDQVKRLDIYTVAIVINKDLKTKISLEVISDKPSKNQDPATEQEAEQSQETELEAETAEAEAVA